MLLFNRRQAPRTQETVVSSNEELFGTEHGFLGGRILREQLDEFVDMFCEFCRDEADKFNQNNHNYVVPSIGQACRKIQQLIGMPVDETIAEELISSAVTAAVSPTRDVFSEPSTVYYSENDVDEDEGEDEIIVDEDEIDDEEDEDEEMFADLETQPQQRPAARDPEDMDDNPAANVNEIDSDEDEDEEEEEVGGGGFLEAQELIQRIQRAQEGAPDESLMSLLERYLIAGNARLANVPARRAYSQQNITAWAGLFCQAWQKIFACKASEMELQLRYASRVFGPLLDTNDTGSNKAISNAFLKLLHRREQVSRGKSFEYTFPNPRGGPALRCRNATVTDLRLVFDLLDAWIPPAIVQKVTETVYNDFILNERMRDISMVQAIEQVLALLGVNPRLDANEKSVGSDKSSSFSMFDDIREYLEMKRDMEEKYRLELKIRPDARPPSIPAFEAFMAEKARQRKATSDIFSTSQLEVIKKKGSTISKILFVYIFFLEESNRFRFVSTLQALVGAQYSMLY